MIIPGDFSDAKLTFSWECSVCHHRHSESFSFLCGAEIDGPYQLPTGWAKPGKEFLCPKCKGVSL